VILIGVLFVVILVVFFVVIVFFGVDLIVRGNCVLSLFGRYDLDFGINLLLGCSLALLETFGGVISPVGMQRRGWCWLVRANGLCSS